MAEPVEKAEEESREETPAACCSKAPRLLEPDLAFKKELEEFGGGTYNKCYQCATCSAVCSLAPESDPFPRKEMLWTMWGLKDRLIRNPDLWMCYYCGGCSETCPREAHLTCGSRAPR